MYHNMHLVFVFLQWNMLHVMYNIHDNIYECMEQTVYAYGLNN